MKKLAVFLCAMLLMFGIMGTANGELHDRGGGLIYDDVLNITWLQDANYARTSGDDSDGMMTWSKAKAWVEGLEYGGYDDWRLVSMDVNGDGVYVDAFTATEFECRDDEYAYMYYYNMGGSNGADLTGNQIVDGITIDNIQSACWSGTDATTFMPDAAMFFNFKFGVQAFDPKNFDDFYVWAVRDGDVGASPEQSVDPSCISSKLKAASTYCKFLVNCNSKNLKKPDAIKLSASLDKTYAKFEKLWAKAEANASKKGINCDTADASEFIFSIDDGGIDLIHQEIKTNVNTDTKDGRNLASSLLKAAGTYCSNIFKAESQNAKRADTGKLSGSLGKAYDKFLKSWNKAIAKAGKKDATYTGNIATIECIIDDMVADILNSLGLDSDGCTDNDVGTVVSAGQVWMDRNLGASRVATSPTDSAAYGDYYQWGRGTDGHEKRTSSTTSISSSTDDPGHGSFILKNSSQMDWRVPQNNNLWQGESGTNNPCPAGFRLPTETELDNERASWSSNNSAGAFNSPLKLVLAGSRRRSVGTITNVGSFGYLWSSTVNGYRSRLFNFYSGDASMGNATRANGFCVRCLED